MRHNRRAMHEARLHGRSPQRLEKMAREQRELRHRLGDVRMRASREMMREVGPRDREMMREHRMMRRGGGSGFEQQHDALRHERDALRLGTV